MIYIHKLGDLSPKAAEIESVPLVRELRKKLSFPISSESITEILEEFFPSETDFSAISKAIERIAPSLKKLEEIKTEENECYEQYNVQRATNMMKEIELPLKKSLEFLQTLNKKEWLDEARETLNAMPKGDPREINLKLNELFEKILIGKDFRFDSKGTVSEGIIETAIAFQESMAKHFLFKITLEEQIQKKHIQEILRRVPLAEIEKNDVISCNADLIRTGTERAYAANLHLIELGIMLYSLVRWIQSRTL
jgi:hypothetical protein